MGEADGRPYGGGGRGGGVNGLDPQRGPDAPVEGNRGRSCKGCLYYSSLLKAHGRKPVCLGVSRGLKQVPGNVVGESELEATKEGRSLTDFKYACVGYSVFLDNKDNQVEKQGKPAEVPFCVGIELLVDKRATDAASAHIHNREDGTAHTQPRGSKQPSHSVGQEFLSRFSRNAGLVASGAARNMNRVGNYVKDNLDDIFDDILYFFRRPK